MPLTRSRPNRRDTLTEKDFQEAFQKWWRRWDQYLQVGRKYFEGDGGRWPYSEFYDFYSVSPEYFGYTLLLTDRVVQSAARLSTVRMTELIPGGETCLFSEFIFKSRFVNCHQSQEV
jgi:hypothetical protein